MKAPSLIPFVVGLIGYELCLKDCPDNWNYGPEYKFHVGINSSIFMSETNDFLYFNITICLGCRPFSSMSDDRIDGLQCYVKEVEINNNTDFLTDESKKNNEDDLFEIVGKFEIIYNKKGIKELKIQSPNSPWCLNIFRTIANQLNIGFDRFDKGGERFAVVEVIGYENSTIGECETKFEVSKQLTDRVKHWNNSKCENKIYLETYAYGNNNPMIAIDKIRDTNKCLKSTPHIFGFSKYKNDKLQLINIKMVSSLTSFFVGPMSFQSQTRNIAVQNSNNGTIIQQSEEAIDLLLESIEPAQDEFKQISQPGITTIFANAPISYPH